MRPGYYQGLLPRKHPLLTPAIDADSTIDCANPAACLGMVSKAIGAIMPTTWD